MSDAMTVAEPRVSTAARCRTMALRRAIRWTPIESTAVTTAGRPSGTAATASATPRMSTSKKRGAPRTCSTRIIVDDHDDGDGDHREAENLAGAIEFPLQRCRFVRGLLQKSGNAAHFGAHPGCGHNRPAVAVGRGGAAENHVVPIAERHVLVDRRGVLGDRQALAGQSGFGGLKRGRLDQAGVGGNGVPFVNQEDVAGHDLGGGDAPPVPAPNHGCSAADIARSAETAASALASWMYPSRRSEGRPRRWRWPHRARPHRVRTPTGRPR